MATANGPSTTAASVPTPPVFSNATATAKAGTSAALAAQASLRGNQVKK